MKIRSFYTVLSVTALAAVTACAPMRRNEAYARPVAYAPVPAPEVALYGQVNGIEVIPVASRSSGGGGAVIGAVLGGLVGNQFGKGGGRAAATGLGVIGGAVAGNRVEQNRSRREDELFRVSVQFQDGSQRAFDFQRVDDLRVGDRVMWEGGQLHRV